MASVELGRYKRLLQYLWDPEPVNQDSKNTSIWCLGIEYKGLHDSSSTTELQRPLTTRNPLSLALSRPATPPESASNSVNSTCDDIGHDDASWPPGFLDDFESRITFTYRSGFPPIPRAEDVSRLSSQSLSVRLRNQLVEGAGFTSDTGWGCMIRSGQTLLANALMILNLGRDWRRGSIVSERKILNLFADHPKAPYSIHKFVEHGAAACGKDPGEWFGPSATARCIRALTEAHESSDLKVYHTGDALEVYEDSFMAIAKPDGINFKPTLVLIGTRLGLDQITPAYWEALTWTLKMPNSLGIAGGQPSSSHYFIGVQGTQFFYLDPHKTQPALRLPTYPDDLTEEDVDSCHTRRLRKIELKEIDPSMLIAFLIRNENDWREWRRSIQETQGKAIIIHVSDHDPGLHGRSTERNAAIDEVESFDDDDGNDDVDGNL